jgi:hypothetical protein
VVGRDREAHFALDRCALEAKWARPALREPAYAKGTLQDAGLREHPLVRG